MMNKRNVILITALLICTIGAFIVFTIETLFDENNPRVYTITVIAGGKSTDMWESVKQGAEQAAGELFVDLSFVTLPGENIVEEQIFFLEREYATGAQAIIISAADSTLLQAPINEINEEIPVILIETPLEGAHPYPLISADDYLMGALLAEEVKNSGNSHKRIAVIKSGGGLNNILNRERGFTNTMGSLLDEVFYWDLNSEGGEEMLLENILAHNADVLIALDYISLEICGQILSDTQRYTSVNLVGIDASGKIASFIERGIVRATIVKNDFAIGYLGVQRAVDILEHHENVRDITVEHRLITTGNMYEMENQRLLFPFMR